MNQPGVPTLGRSLSLALEQLVPLLRSLAAGSVSPTTYAVLARLERSGEIRLSELAHGVGVSQPAMTQLVNRMEDEGFVVRMRSGHDRRGVLVAIARHGREVLTDRRERRVALLDELAGRLDEADRAAIAGALPALGRLIEQVQDEGKARS
jgi:DNA-binding MarR family transcriptional regulator